MSSYRFCRTDDIGLLVDALNHCWAPHFPDEPPMTEAAFKRSIRDLQVWCSSCMVAFSGSTPIGVLIGAKRSSRTLIHRIAVHPDHVRQGHGRHLLTSLSSKLAILGPPSLVAEVPEAFTAACALFSASGYVVESMLTDYVVPYDSRGSGALAQGGDTSQQAAGFVIPVTVDDIAANGLLGGPPSPVASATQGPSEVCWERSVETLTARKDDIAGLAVASDERIEAYLLYTPGGELLSLRCFVGDGGARLSQLLSMLRARLPGSLRWPKVHPAEIAPDVLATLGLHPTRAHRLVQARALPA